MAPQKINPRGEVKRRRGAMAAKHATSEAASNPKAAAPAHPLQPPGAHQGLREMLMHADRMQPAHDAGGQDRDEARLLISEFEKT